MKLQNLIDQIEASQSLEFDQHLKKHYEIERQIEQLSNNEYISLRNEAENILPYGVYVEGFINIPFPRNQINWAIQMQDKFSPPTRNSDMVELAKSILDHLKIDLKLLRAIKYVYEFDQMIDKSDKHRLSARNV